MTPPERAVQPPAIAVWLVTLFAPAQQAETMLGDLLEEFSDIASKSGATSARSWYRRQVARTVLYLVVGGIRSAPWSIGAGVLVGYLLLKFGFMLYGQVADAVLDRYVYSYLSELGSRQPSTDIAEYMFWINRGWMIGRALVAMLVGATVALLFRGREMTVTGTLGLVTGASGITLSLLGAAENGDLGFFFIQALPTVFTNAIAVVVGAAIVRMSRPVARMRPSAT